MTQIDLWGNAALEKPVNVASVPHRSPFRYPGGKTWLIPRIRQWLSAAPRPTSELIEPFAGGGIVSLTCAAEGLAEHVTMVELDDQVAAVWRTLFNGDALELADRIVSFQPTPESVAAVLAGEPRTDLDRAFQTIVKNRTYHGGILAHGSAPIKHGENGRGIASRWYAQTLFKRIHDIHAIRDRVTFISGDGIEVMRQFSEREDVAFFIDPPYTAAGKKAGSRLYTHFELEHDELFRVASELAGDFLMTYDDAEGVRDLVHRYGFDMELVAMQNTHLAKMTELLIVPSVPTARGG